MFLILHLKIVFIWTHVVYYRFWPFNVCLTRVSMAELVGYKPGTSEGGSG